MNENIRIFPSMTVRLPDGGVVTNTHQLPGRPGVIPFVYIDSLRKTRRATLKWDELLTAADSHRLPGTYDSERDERVEGWHRVAELVIEKAA